jgi:Zn-dependent protease with chaperone function
MQVSRLSAVVVLMALLGAQAASAQTTINPPKNKYKPQQDVELGREAAGQVEQQLPILHDDSVTSYVQEIGRRLVDSIPADQRHPEFQYTFKVVNVKEINAFALPGGPMYVNRGMLEAAKTEGEVVGVLAHEMSHVALRHGTAQATKATKYEVGTIVGAVVGAVVGGQAGNIIAQGTQFGLGTAFLRFSREFEKQADIEGAQIMARAGYDPRDMANMFKTIEAQGGPGGPQWLSDHPNPGDRYAYINKEAQSLHVQNAVHDSNGFQSTQARLHQMSPAPSTEQATKNAGNRGPTRGEGGPISGNVQRPASSFKAYTEGNLFRISVPSNWRELPGNSSVTFAPEGAYGTANQQGVFTHGTEVGVARNEAHDLQTATDDLIQSLVQSNPRLRQASGYSRTAIGSRDGLTTTLSNVSDATGRNERVSVFTTLMQDGTLFYMIGVAPDNEFGSYEPVFRKVASSIQFAR